MMIGNRAIRIEMEQDVGDGLVTLDVTLRALVPDRVASSVRDKILDHHRCGTLTARRLAEILENP